MIQFKNSITIEKYITLLLPLLFFTGSQFISSCKSRENAGSHFPAYSTKLIDTLTISGRGILLQLEDSGYPLAWAAIQDKSQSDTIFCQLNYVDFPELNPGVTAEWIQKEVTYTALKFPEKSLLDVHFEGISLLAGDTQIPLYELEKCTGILSGATEPTAGDLPGQIRIHDPEGESLIFSCFITPEMVRAEGSIVTGYYRIDQIVSLKSLSINK